MLQSHCHSTGVPGSPHPCGGKGTSIWSAHWDAAPETEAHQLAPCHRCAVGGDWLWASHGTHNNKHNRWVDKLLLYLVDLWRTLKYVCLLQTPNQLVLVQSLPYWRTGSFSSSCLQVSICTSSMWYKGGIIITIICGESTCTCMKSASSVMHDWKG